MALVISETLTKNYKIPAEKYRYLRAGDLGNYLWSLGCKVLGNYSISYKLYDGFDIAPEFIKNKIFDRVVNFNENVMLCPRSFLEITIKLHTGYTQILQYSGYFATELIKIITNPQSVLQLTVYDACRQNIIANSKSYPITTGRRVKLIYWPN